MLFQSIFYIVRYRCINDIINSRIHISVIIISSLPNVYTVFRSLLKKISNHFCCLIF